ncbi:MAG TPA: serine hydrolase domain-containing protein [Candidatus Acidoferrales bacterium]|nr:serine hydrolase domain-containing protein [Candidatus Acidoferrales bacterium]
MLVARGDDVYRGAFGYANIEKRVLNANDTQFEIASLSKMFTAIAILKLRDAGKLRLSDSICTYIDSCPAAWRPVTIDEVLHHRSGLPDYEDSLEIDSPAYFAFMTAPDSSKRIVEREKPLPLDFPPGSKFSYSNTGYVVLGFIVERASRETIARYLHETIFGPAGMNDTGVIGVDPSPRLATGYTVKTEWGQRLPGFTLEDVHASPVPALSLTAPEGDAGIFSTAGDLLTWARIMLGAKPALVSAEERAEILHGVEGYGDGWMIRDAFGLPRFLHTGELPGYLSNVMVFPTVGTISIVLDNLDTPMNAFTRDVSAIAIGKPYDPPFSGALVTLTPAQDAALFGRYKQASGEIVCVAMDGTLLAASTPRYKAGLLPLAPDRFYMPLASGLVTFTLGSNGVASQMNLRYNGEDHVASRVEAPCPAGTL